MRIPRFELAASVSLLILLVFSLPALADTKEEMERLTNSGTVLQEVLGVPEGIPADLLDKAECVAVFPSVKKLALGIGGSYGKGAMVCRSGKSFDGPWGAPAMMRLEGGSIGFQIGGSATDLILLVMNPKGAQSLLNSKVKLGADASVAGGPKGRTASAETDAFMAAEILSYSRSRGAFAGVSLEGSTMREDSGANKDLYGREISAKEIVIEGGVKTPKAGAELVDLLQKRSPENKSE